MKDEKTVNILIVDDKEDICKTYKEILEDSLKSSNIFTANTYEEAVNIVEKNSIDLIIADIFLKDDIKSLKDSGIDVSYEAKKKDLNTQIIIFTGIPAVNTATEAIHLEAFDYLTKPVKPEALIRSTINALDKKRLLDDRNTIEQEKNILQSKLEDVLSEKYITDKQFQKLMSNFKNKRKKLESHSDTVQKKLIDAISRVKLGDTKYE